MESIKFANGDILLEVATGRPRRIRGLEKVSQDIAHALLTRYDARRMRGSELLDFENRVRGADVMPVAAAGFVRRYVEDAIRRLMRYQERNRSKIPDDEFIASIERVDVFPGSSPTDVFFYAAVLIKDGSVAPSAFQINLRHQLSDNARRFLPGAADDYGPTVR